MKEKYTKPNINIMKIVIIGGEEKNEENENGILYYGNGDIGGGVISGEDDGEL